MPKIAHSSPTPRPATNKKMKQLKLDIVDNQVSQVLPYTKIPNNIYVDFPQPKPTAKIDWSDCNCSGQKHCCLNGCELHAVDIECHIKAHGGVDCGNQKLQRRQFAKTAVKPAGLKGNGLFALEDIKPNALINEYVGEIISEATCEARLTKKHFYALKLANNKFIDSSMFGNETRFINHSCEPNAEGRYVVVGDVKRVAIFSTQCIKKGEEITFDYNYEDWGQVPSKCYCGCKSCTGFMDKNYDPSAAEVK
ncbi:Histone-lysine_N-methyltransferase [Hexamita inflata]|uniref:Histone-lysine_N-methyltransferase n=1 Tax=Hexamita inflata TaxID=28002 RepID=A0ABP1JAM4_9EUKA